MFCAKRIIDSQFGLISLCTMTDLMDLSDVVFLSPWYKHYL